MSQELSVQNKDLQTLLEQADNAFVSQAKSSGSNAFNSIRVSDVEKDDGSVGKALIKSFVNEDGERTEEQLDKEEWIIPLTMSFRFQKYNETEGFWEIESDHFYTWHDAGYLYKNNGDEKQILYYSSAIDINDYLKENYKDEERSEKFGKPISTVRSQNFVYALLKSDNRVYRITTSWNAFGIGKNATEGQFNYVLNQIQGAPVRCNVKLKLRSFKNEKGIFVSVPAFYEPTPIDDKSELENALATMKKTYEAIGAENAYKQEFVQSADNSEKAKKEEQKKAKPKKETKQNSNDDKIDLNDLPF